MIHLPDAVTRSANRIYLPAIIFLCGFGYFEYVTLTQYWSHHIYLADIGSIDVAIANTLRGKIFLSPISDWNFLAVHFHPVLLLVVPLYLIFSHVLTLATVYNLGLIAAVFPLYYFALAKLKDRWLAAGFAIAYLFNHFVLSIHLALHTESLLMIGFFTMFLGVETKRKWLYWLGVIWALMVKEDVSIYVIFYAIYLGFIRREKQRHLAILTIGVALVWLSFTAVIMSSLRPPTGEYKGGLTWVVRYPSFGKTWQEIFLYALTHPWVIMARIFSRPAFYHLVLSAGLLPLLHPRSLWLILIPSIPFLTTDFEPMYNLLYYYGYAFIPFLFLSAIEGTARILQITSPSIKLARVIKFAILAILGVTVLVSINAPTRTDRFKHRPFTVTAHHRLLKTLIKKYIPPEAAVAAQYELFCQVPHREVLLPLWLENLDRVEYAIIDETRLAPDLTGRQKAEIIKILTQPPFKLIAEADGYYIFQRQQPDN